MDSAPNVPKYNDPPVEIRMYFDSHLGSFEHTVIVG